MYDYFSRFFFNYIFSMFVIKLLQMFNSIVTANYNNNLKSYFIVYLNFANLSVDSPSE